MDCFLRLIVSSMISLVLVISLSGCDKSKDQQQNTQKKLDIIKVKKEPVYKTLYFSGTLSPNKQISVTAPNDGVVLEKDFQYGQMVSKGQQLFILESSKQASEFQSALASYLKSKEQLNNDYGTLQSTESLYKKGLVPENEFAQAKSTYYLSQLSLLQAQSQLKDALKYYRFNKDIFSLSISDIKDISETIAKSLKAERIHIFSPADGIALLPVQTSSDESSSSGGDSNTVVQGGQVKSGQILVTVGLLQGLAIQAKANEIDINELTKGLKATVTSVAFPNISLHGEITNIASQATSSGSLPVFNIRIVVPKLDAAARKVVRIGMSAKASVKIEQAPQIIVPISAVFNDPKTNETMVTKIINGKKSNVVVETGQTSMDSVVILSGLNPGDEIVGSHQAQ